MQIRLITLVACCLFAVSGCMAQNVMFQGSPLQPAADARATIRVDQNENTLVELELEHIAPAEKLWPPRALYVVWVEDSEGEIQQLGKLRVNDERKAHFQGTTELERFRLLITAEDNPRPEQPSQPYMLATDYFSADDGWLR